MADQAGDKPLYEAIRDQLIAEIRSGRRYPAGALLPSVREIMAQWSVSTTTARRVLAELVSAGYARSEGPRGHISNGPGATTPKLRPIPRPGVGSLVDRDHAYAAEQPSPELEARLDRMAALAAELAELVAELRRDYGVGDTTNART
jgi:DNA-binding transcriptional MocR family regulator